MFFYFRSVPLKISCQISPRTDDLIPVGWQVPSRQAFFGLIWRSGRALLVGWTKRREGSRARPAAIFRMLAPKRSDLPAWADKVTK